MGFEIQAKLVANFAIILQYPSYYSSHPLETLNPFYHHFASLYYAPIYTLMFPLTHQLEFIGGKSIDHKITQ